jgi:ribosomal protein S18 acetylase RimI-like enzyme
VPQTDHIPEKGSSKAATPSLHGQGFGTQLIQSVITEARHAGASLKLDVLKTNPARRLYERLGFTTHRGNRLFI